MDTNEFQKLIDAEKPLFDYVRNLLAVLVFWTTILVSWALVNSSAFTAYGGPAPVFRVALIAASAFGFFLIIRLSSLTTALMQLLAKQMNKSKWRAIRLLSIPLYAGSGLAMAVFMVILVLSIMPPLFGLMRTLAQTAPL